MVKLAELRLWKIGKSIHKIIQDSKRFYLVVKLDCFYTTEPMKELGMLFMIFQTSPGFNKNHEHFVEQESLGQRYIQLPVKVSLLLAYTDEIGNYILNTPFQGSGEVL